MNRVLVLAAMTFAVALTSRAQTTGNPISGGDLPVVSNNSFEQAVSGTDFPLQIAFGDMKNSWRRMQISGSDEDLLSHIYSSSNPRNFQPQIFYTRGQSIEINGEPFLVAYKLAPSSDLVPSRDRFGNINNWPQVPQLLTLDTRLELALLNPRLISRFSAIRVLDVAQELRQNAAAVQSARLELARTINQASLNNLQQIGQQLRNYTQSTGKLPSLQTSAAAQKDLQRFGFSSPSPFQHPSTGKSYATNAALSGKTIKQISDPSRVVVFYETEVSPDDTRGVVFADGSASRIKESELARLIKASTTAGATKLKTVPLYGAAALRWMYARGIDANGKKVQLYQARGTGRIYYRDPNTHMAIYVTPPMRPLVVPASEAIQYQNYAGYNGRKTGQKFGGYGYPPAPPM